MTEPLSNTLPEELTLFAKQNINFVVSDFRLFLIVFDNVPVSCQPLSLKAAR